MSKSLKQWHKLMKLFATLWSVTKVCLSLTTILSQNPKYDGKSQATVRLDSFNDKN